MPSFADIAKKKVADTEKPPLPPVGHYVMQVVNDPAIVERESANGKFEILDFILQGVQQMDDVDLEELKKFGGAKGVRVKHSFIFNTAPEEEANFQQTEYRLQQFLSEHLQIEGVDKMSYSESLPAAKNKRVLVEVGHRPDKNKPDTFYSDVKSTAAVS